MTKTAAISRDNLADELAATHDLDPTPAREAVDFYAAQLDAADGDLTDEDAEHVRRAIAAHLAHDSGAALDLVADATAALSEARRATEEAEMHWRASIRAAVLGGQRVVDVADVAEVSRERVYQIRDGRR